LIILITIILTLALAFSLLVKFPYLTDFISRFQEKPVIDTDPGKQVEYGISYYSTHFILSVGQDSWRVEYPHRLKAFVKVNGHTKCSKLPISVEEHQFKYVLHFHSMWTDVVIKKRLHIV
jgi:hypothetical protein